jgi:NAD(P)-dependent dehydrogenase (short-subunit alcohol dehydrogenase family)
VAASDLARAGYRVLATGRSRERLAGGLAGTPVEPVEMELDAPSVARVVDAAGPLDVLVYNAGRIDLASLFETTPETFEESFGVPL